MWFNNGLIYHCQQETPISLSQSLAEDYLKPCPPHARFIYGWLPTVDDDLVHEVSGGCLIALGKEERILPRGVINRLLNEQIAALEAQRGYSVKRSERSQLAEELEFQLLPKAFCLQKRLFALIDDATNRLMINTASANQASQLISLLRKSAPSLHIEPLLNIQNLSATLTAWVKHPETLPASLELAAHCVLTAPDDDTKRFTCKGYELPADEVLNLLDQGLAVTEVALIWQDRIELTLTEDFVFKRVKCLDYLVDQFNDIRQLDDHRGQQDASLMLLTGEWRALVNDLMNAFSQSDHQA
jgi:recombination associated protein RdgC